MAAQPIRIEPRRDPNRGRALSRRTTAGLVWLSSTVAVVLQAGALWLAFLTQSYVLAGEQPLWLRALLFLPCLLAFVTVGALVAARRPAHPIGWLFIAIGLVAGAGECAEGYWRYALVMQPGALPAGVLMRSVGSWPYSLALGLMLFGLLLFPDGRLPSRRWRPVAWLVILSVGTAGLGEVFKPGRLPHPVLLDHVLGLTDRAGVWELLQNLGSALTACSALLVASALIVRFRRARGVGRQQLKWFAYATALFAVSFSILFTPWAAVANAGFIVAALASGLIPVGVGIAILRYRLYDIDLIINRTLVYGALTALVVALYVLVVGALSAVFQTTTTLIPSLLATGLVAVLFHPLRERVQRGVNHMLYGERDDPYAVLARLGRRLEATLAPEAVLPTIVQTVTEALKLPYAAITLTQADGFRPAAVVGTPVDAPLTLPLVYQHETVGQLLLGPRAPGEPFSPADQRLLADLARQAGVAAHAVRLTADLQHARQRLVSAREEERRRLRRDLHDGLGPALATVTLQADTARSLIRSAPDEADALLRELTAQAQATLGEVRQLIYALRPPVLDDLGLSAALRALAAPYTQGGVTVTVSAPDQLPPLPAAIEVAAYRIAQEALTNVVRHARARTCVIRLGVSAGLGLEIVDDGVGLPAECGAGVGLRSMRERAAELGGTCVIQPCPHGGTQVLVELPLPPAEEERAGAAADSDRR